jgi:hypothetical protein
MIAKLKDVRWPIVGRAFIWTAIWLAVFALEFIMSWALADKQPVIFGIIMVSVIIGSVCLAHALLNWHGGAWGSAMAVLAVGIVAVAVHATFNVSFWSGIVTEINEQVAREKAALTARAIVAEKRKERYAHSASGKSASQIDADLKAMEFDERWTRSKKCTDATVPASRSFCAEYFTLKGQRDGAVEAGNLEGIVWNAGTTVETEVKRNLAAAAHLFARWFGGEAEGWTGRIVLAVALLIQLVLAFAFVIGYAPDKRKTRQDRATAAEAPRGMDITPRAVAPAPRSPMKPWPHSAVALQTASVGQPPLASKLPGSGGTGSLPTDEPPSPPGDVKPVTEAAPEPKPVTAGPVLVTEGGKSVQKSAPSAVPDQKVTQKVVDFPTKVTKYRKVKANKHGKVGRTVDWLGETATQMPDSKVRISSEDCYSNYKVWCDLHGLYAVPWRTFTKKLTAHLRIKNPERNSRNGQRMFSLLLTDPSQWKQSLRATA